MTEEQEKPQEEQEPLGDAPEGVRQGEDELPAQPEDQDPHPSVPPAQDPEEQEKDNG